MQKARLQHAFARCIQNYESGIRSPEQKRKGERVNHSGALLCCWTLTQDFHPRFLCALHLLSALQGSSASLGLVASTQLHPSCLNSRERKGGTAGGLSMADFELSSPKRLGRTVVLGYCDIAAAGIRVLEGMSAPTGETANIRETGRESLTFSGAGASIFDGVPALEAVHFDGGGGSSDDKSVTLLKLNTAVGRDLSASLSLALVDLLDAHRSTLGRVIIAAAVQPPKRHQIPPAATVAPSSTATGAQQAKAYKVASFPPDTVCAFSCDGYRGSGGGGGNGNGDGSLSSPPPLLPVSACNLPPLPPGARIADSFLTTLVRLCRLEGLPLLLLARLGYRATGAAADVDGTDEAIDGLGKCLEQVIGLRFDGEKACGARRSKGWKGISPAQGVVPGYI